MTGLFAAALALLAVAGAVDLVLSPGRLARPARAVPYLMGAAASVCLAVVGAVALAGHPVLLPVGRLLGQPLIGQWTAGLTVDRLSGMFLLMAFGAAAPVSLAFASWAVLPIGGRRGNGPASGDGSDASRGRGPVGRRGLGVGYALALGATAVVMTAGDAFTFYFGWESLTLAFYLLAGFERARPQRPRAAQVTFAFGKASGAALLAGLLLLVGASHSIDLAAFGHVTDDALRITAMTLLLGAFAIKTGIVPFQVWLPRGYAAAPGPARAVMAGVCVNVGFYGMWRTLALLGRPPGWLDGLLLLLAAAAALLGIAHAAVASRLPRVIAYSSVENSGLITVGFAIAMIGVTVGDRRLTAAGLLAATLQMVTHTAAKSLLFTASAGVEATAAGTRSGSDGPGGERQGDDGPAGADDMDMLRGSIRRAPWSATGLAIGSLTLAGLPPTAGFVSEWFLLEALMQQFRVPGLGFRLVLAVAGATVALTAGFAGVTFVRVVGMVVLGGAQRHPGPGTDPAPPAPPGALASGSRGGGGATGRVSGASLAVAGEYGWSGRVAVVVLSIWPLLLAALTPLEVRAVAAGLAPVVARTVTAGALRSPWVVQPVFGGFSVLSPSWAWIELPGLVVVVWLFALAVSGSRMWRIRRVPAWRSATIGVDDADSYTAFGYANPARTILTNVLRPRRRLTALDPGADDAAPSMPHLEYGADVTEVVEQLLYRPALRAVMIVARAAKRIQSGRLDAYLGYMLVALMAVIALVAALA